MVSFSVDRGDVVGISNSSIPLRPSKDLPPVALANDELLSGLLQMRQSETACSHGDPRSASIMTVTGVDAVGCMRQQLDLLVTSIQTTMTTEVNGAM